MPSSSSGGRPKSRKSGGAALPVLPLLLLLCTSPIIYVMFSYEAPADAVARTPPPRAPTHEPHVPHVPRPPAMPREVGTNSFSALAEKAWQARERALKEPVADILLPPMYGGPDAKPKTIGLERCAAFRSMAGARGRPAVAGLFNTGTNFLMKLLRNNCQFPDACPAALVPKSQNEYNPYEEEIKIMAEMQLSRRRGRKCSPFLLQVPWGKHNPVDWRGDHAAQGMEDVDVNSVLPVVVVKDPFTWMRSMCRMEYAAKFRHGQAQCCPHPVMRTKTVVRFRKERPARNYTSVVDFWREWNEAYERFKHPRLLVRYEDLLFNSQETTKEVCECSGGTMKPTFDPIAQGAKGGAGHGYHETGHNVAAATYSNETLRYAKLTDADVAYVLDHAGPLRDTFHYAASTMKRWQFGDSRICQPDREQWLHSVGLKSSRDGPVPIDDESDGVVVNGFYFRNPKKPKRPGAIFNAIQRANRAHRAHRP